MSDTILIEGTVRFAPNELNHNIRQLLVEKLSAKYITCNINNGYIQKIVKINNKYTTLIDNNSSDIVISIKFMAQRILPTIGMKLDCVVNTIFNHGIFAQIEDKIKILIPVATMRDYSFDHSGSVEAPGIPVFKSSTVTIGKHDTIKIIITDVKYSKNRYNCIGKLI